MQKKSPRAVRDLATDERGRVKRLGDNDGRGSVEASIRVVESGPPASGSNAGRIDDAGHSLAAERRREKPGEPGLEPHIVRRARWTLDAGDDQLGAIDGCRVGASVAHRAWNEDEQGDGRDQRDHEGRA